MSTLFISKLKIAPKGDIHGEEGKPVQKYENSLNNLNSFDQLTDEELDLVNVGGEDEVIDLDFVAESIVNSLREADVEKVRLQVGIYITEL